MKFLEKEYDHGIENGKLKIYDTFHMKVIADMPMNYEAIDWEQLDGCDYASLFVPYNDDELKNNDSIKDLMYTIANNTEFYLPDVENSSLFIMIDYTKEEIEADLLIQVQPPKYSEEERAEILAKADKETDENGFSEYMSWINIFELSDAFHNGDESICNDNAMDMFPITLTQEETTYIENKLDTLLKIA